MIDQLVCFMYNVSFCIFFSIIVTKLSPQAACNSAYIEIEMECLTQS